jgi:hypothetical protein
MRPYVVVAPDFSPMCAGITTLHKLCHMLNERGCVAYTTGRTPPAGYHGLFNTKTTHSLSKEECEYLQYNGVVVYPDIVPGNPLRFTNVVRWWVGIPQYKNDNELTVSLAKNHDFNIKVENHLCIWHVEDFFIPPENENRYKTCYTVHKSIEAPPIAEIAPGSIRIDHNFTRKEVVKLFQESSVFYSYDDCTLLTVESRLCGCPTKILRHNTFPKENLKNSVFSRYGISFPDEQLDIGRLKSEMPLFRESYEALKMNTEKELDIFIENTQTMEYPYVENPLHEQAPQTWLPWDKFGIRK